MISQYLSTLLQLRYSNPELSLELFPVSGGDIHRSFKVKVATESVILFAKVNLIEHGSVLQAEHQALVFFQNTVMANYYPKPILHNVGEKYSCLVMEYLPLCAINSVSASELGESLAKQHLVRADAFGWDQDNFIGLTPQRNRWTSDWPHFFAEQRLAPQLELALNNGLSKQIAIKVDGVIDDLDRLLNGDVKPSLLHGDLWGGNVSAKSQASGSELQAVLYDPAPYFGDPEVDIAMTRLFGSLPASFYASYYQTHPLRAGADRRALVYDLYHWLNHFNLFGASYEANLLQCVARLDI